MKIERKGEIFRINYFDFNQKFGRVSQELLRRIPSVNIQTQNVIMQFIGFRETNSSAL